MTNILDLSRDDDQPDSNMSLTTKQVDSSTLLTRAINMKVTLHPRRPLRQLMVTSSLKPTVGHLRDKSIVVSVKRNDRYVNLNVHYVNKLNRYKEKRQITFTESVNKDRGWRSWLQGLNRKMKLERPWRMSWINRYGGMLWWIRTGADICIICRRPEISP